MRSMQGASPSLLKYKESHSSHTHILPGSWHPAVVGETGACVTDPLRLGPGRDVTQARRDRVRIHPAQLIYPLTGNIALLCPVPTRHRTLEITTLQCKSLLFTNKTKQTANF